ncbi:hypothetical protein JP09_009440 [Dehalogenimonas etheniformans]|uniref:Uncharacterized protein n=1 Tax=Dehalogenimonas etheniformans TaxID=1536648 RepID=A0A2P5P5H7_9CHLR|nr:hypothetical protein JP09_009440 [Dehalogenimonas etheniformans]
MAGGVGDRNTKRLTLIAFVLTMTATLILFFVPTFRHYSGVIVHPEDSRYVYQTAWDHFTFNQNTPDVPWFFFFFIIPLVPTMIGYLASRFRDKSKCKRWLWFSTALMTGLVLLNAFYFSLYFLPAAACLLAAAINETRKSPAVHGSTGSPRTT